MREKCYMKAQYHLGRLEGAVAMTDVNCLDSLQFFGLQTERMAILERVAEAAKKFSNAELLGMSILRTEDLSDLKRALAVLEKE